MQCDHYKPPFTSPRRAKDTYEYTVYAHTYVRVHTLCGMGPAVPDCLASWGRRLWLVEPFQAPKVSERFT